MELMKKVILAACILSVCLTIADSLKPGEKFGKQLKFIFSLVFMTGIISSVSGSDFEFELPASTSVESLDGYEELTQAADNAMISSAQTSVIDMVSRILTARGISFEKITADINMTEDGSININQIGYCGDDLKGAQKAVSENIGEIEVKSID